jgi:hypothetical protein
MEVRLLPLTAIAPHPSISPSGVGRPGRVPASPAIFLPADALTAPAPPSSVMLIASPAPSCQVFKKKTMKVKTISEAEDECEGDLDANQGTSRTQSVFFSHLFGGSISNLSKEFAVFLMAHSCSHITSDAIAILTEAGGLVRVIAPHTIQIVQTFDVSFCVLKRRAESDRKTYNQRMS